MGRRRSGAFEDLLVVASKLPWKWGLALAPAAFLLFHAIAAVTAQEAGPAKIDGLGGVVIRQFLHVFSFLLQFVVPAGFLIGAITSYIREFRSRGLIAKVRSSQVPVESIGWDRFEFLIAEAFRQRGYRVEERGGRAPDGGIDLKVVNEHGRFFVQCKHWRVRQVGVAVIRECLGVMVAGKAAGAWVVTSGGFTEEATRFAEANRIQLLDGPRLPEFLRTQEAIQTPSKLSGSSTPHISKPSTPHCSACGTPMIERVAKKGANAGAKFWGCSNFPRCRKTIGMAA